MDRDAAYDKLLEALKDAQDNAFEVALPQSIGPALEEIIFGEHLTFRYILLTAILGKSIDPSIHTRALQAQAPLNGAYDARSLCHSVIIPFERNELALRLGGSNEPFLNKPARFVAVEKTNSVRRGRDKALLDTLYNVLEELNDESQEVVKHALIYTLRLILCRKEKFSSTLGMSNIFATQITALQILHSITCVCSGGESAVIVTGALLRILYFDSAIVRISPVNQAGSSSREVGDIDLIQNGLVVCAIEVKDKSFTEHDVLHAVQVAQESNVHRLLFVIGSSVPRETIPDLNLIISNLSKNGFDISFAFIEQFSGALVSLFSHQMRQMVIDEIPKIVDEMRATDATKQHIQNVFHRFQE